MVAKPPIPRIRLHFAIWIVSLAIFAVLVAAAFYSLAL
jgi:hypothetical protein